MLVFQKGPFLDEMTLSSEAVMHIKARRLKVGETIVLCDGKGLSAQAKLVELTRNKALCQIESQKHHEKNEYPRLVIGITKLPTLEFIMQKAVEIGVSEIILLKCEYTPIAFDQALFDKKKDRWEKIIVSACEQSEMYYQPKLSWMSFAGYMKTDHPKCMFHPYAKTGEVAKNADIMVGPEGGWSEAELNYDVQLSKLNTGILRADTAAIAALLAHRMN